MLSLFNRTIMYHCSLDLLNLETLPNRYHCKVGQINPIATYNIPDNRVEVIPWIRRELHGQFRVQVVSVRHGSLAVQRLQFDVLFGIAIELVVDVQLGAVRGAVHCVVSYHSAR